MTLAKPISVAPKKPSRPTRVVAGLGDPFAELVERRASEAGLLLGADLRRVVELGDLLEQADLVAAGADDLGAAVADGAIDRSRRRPCPSARFADRSMVSGSGSASISRCGRRGARDRQRAGARGRPSRPVVRFGCWSIELGHAPRMTARNRADAASRSATFASFLPPLTPYMRGRDERAMPPTAVRARRRQSRAAVRHGRARARACRLATNAGLECADEPQPGRAALLADLDYAWDPAWLTAMRGRPGHAC